MVSRPCGSGPTSHWQEPESTVKGQAGQCLAAPDWTLRTGWVAKVRGMEAPSGCAPLGDGGPGPWGRTRHVGVGHR